MSDLPRILLYSHDDAFIRELDPNAITSATTVFEVNGEHSITIETFDELTEGDRILWRDNMLVWHEHVVTGQVSNRMSGGVVLHSYWCTWSLQYDLANTFVSAMPGINTPVGPRAALQAALGGTERWTIGTIGQGGTNGASMFRMSGWEAMQTLVKTWGGEVTATITVGSGGVTARQVNLLSHEGETTPTRRFDYGGDLSGIKRTIAETPWAARVIPLGKAQQTEGGGYGRRTTIEDVNSGVMWLENAAVVPYVRVFNGSTWEIPVRKVETDAYDDPTALKAWAQEHLEEWTTPQASYEADVVQLARAGLDAQGVGLGDEIVVVDRTFGTEGIAIQGRALRIEENLRDPSATRITVSNLQETLGDQLSGLARQVETLARYSAETGEYQATAAYLAELLGRLNAEANMDGGYTYITEGAGLRTYDRPVTDPLVGAEATKVVEIKGGTIRIADSRTSGGDWDWRTVFVAGHIAAELVTAAQITAGYIGSAESGNYWDLDGGMLNLVGNMKLEMDGYHTGAKQYLELSSFREKVVDTYRTLRGIKLYTSGESVDVSMTIGCSDAWYAAGSTSSTTTPRAFIYCDGNFDLVPYRKGEYSGYFQMRNGSAELSSGTTTSKCTIQVGENGIYLVGSIGGTLAWFLNETNASTTTKWSLNGTGIVYGGIKASTLTITGTKSRIVDTDHYADRLLYCDETPSPTFTDFGSGRTDADGLCYVEIDDVFAETTRTDMAYQVFLQQCGRGELWVEEKTPSYFVVHGSPNLAFDWQLKAHQKGYEYDRMEVQSMQQAVDAEVSELSDDPIGELYSDELLYAEKMESLYEIGGTNEAA